MTRDHDRDERAARRQDKVGTVVSDKMDKTVVVAVERRSCTGSTTATMKRTSKFMAHDEENGCKVGDRVRARGDAARCRRPSAGGCAEILKRAEES